MDWSYGVDLSSNYDHLFALSLEQPGTVWISLEQPGSPVIDSTISSSCQWSGLVPCNLRCLRACSWSALTSDNLEPASPPEHDSPQADNKDAQQEILEGYLFFQIVVNRKS